VGGWGFSCPPFAPVGDIHSGLHLRPAALLDEDREVVLCLGKVGPQCKGSAIVCHCLDGISKVVKVTEVEMGVRKMRICLNRTAKPILLLCVILCEHPYVVEGLWMGRMSLCCSPVVVESSRGIPQERTDVHKRMGNYFGVPGRHPDSTAISLYGGIYCLGLGAEEGTKSEIGLGIGRMVTHRLAEIAFSKLDIAILKLCSEIEIVFWFVRFEMHR